MFWGTVFIVIGLVALFKNLGLISADTWGVLWPVLVMALGFSLLSKRHGARGHWPWCNCSDCQR